MRQYSSYRPTKTMHHIKLHSEADVIIKLSSISHIQKDLQKCKTMPFFSINFCCREITFIYPQRKHTTQHSILCNKFILYIMNCAGMWLESNSHVYIVFNHFPADAHLSYYHFSGNKHHYTLYAGEGDGTPLQYSCL